ncbi:MAG: DHH family phosphoesterase [Lachnospiraceae bacterium]|nr:DHH family phosphoesterase [Lachnospiraceae bacterium]
MEALKYHGRLRAYLLMPVLNIILLAAVSIGLDFYHLDAGVVLSGVTVLYTAVVLILFAWVKKKLNTELINFATHYGTVQKKFLRDFQLPYALLDGNGRFIWLNKEFQKLIHKDGSYNKNISTIFPEITPVILSHSEDVKQIIRLEYNGRKYRIELRRLSFEEDEPKRREMITTEELIHSINAVLVFDETELYQIRQLNWNQQMVPAIIYIDNYEETIEGMEVVRRSLLTATIDQKISQYFQQYEGIVQKIEKDKYFVIFQQRCLTDLEENKFSILEEIRGIHFGNESDVTLSIGVGVGGTSYPEVLEYARAAINIALGRGGSQAVVKDHHNVSYYGLHGKEVEKNTRVKARVKAQALREMMTSRDRVIVMGHKITDIDAFGACLGICIAARHLGKECHIVLNTITTSLRPLVDLITKEDDWPDNLILSTQEALYGVDDKTLVVVVDTNRANYTECPELLERSKNIVVFDHHRQGDGLIKNPVLSYIEPYASSTCEMIAEILQYFAERIEIRPKEADCIYAGILIDTNNFMAKTGVRTFEAAAYLRRNGADMTRVRKMLREDMHTYKARAEVVRDAEVYRGSFAISICDPAGLKSPTIVAAQAANELLDITGIKASFVLTEYDNKIYISARSIDEIDVQRIMEKLGGGGHLNLAGAQIEGGNMTEARDLIKRILDEEIEKGDIEL